jgi:hypothetical protein
MRLPEGEWPDPSGWARPVVKLNWTLEGIKQANRGYNEEVFDCVVDDLNLQASIAAPGLFFCGNICKAHGILSPVYFNDIMIIGDSALLISIEYRLNQRF